jgi:hypothetical protein
MMAIGLVGAILTKVSRADRRAIADVTWATLGHGGSALKRRLVALKAPSPSVVPYSWSDQYDKLRAAPECPPASTCRVGGQIT